MIIKVIDAAMQDLFLVEAPYIKWVEPDPVTDHTLLWIFIPTRQSVGTVSSEVMQSQPSLSLRLYHGDRVFIMNDEGKTIDSKHIAIGAKESEICEGCLYIKNVLGGNEQCRKHDKRIYSLSSRRCDLWEWKGAS